MKKIMQEEHGFVLNFTLLFVGVMLTVVVIASNSAYALLQTAENEVKSAKAFYAADTGIECAEYLDGIKDANGYGAFDTMRAEETYNCVPSQTIRLGSNPPTSVCVEKEYEFTIELSNGACTNVSVTTVPNNTVVNGSDVPFCDVDIVSNGRNTCDPDAQDVTERTRLRSL